MKLSLNWLKEYITFDLSPEKLGEVLTEIGLEVEGMEEIESIKGGLKGVLIGHVLECAKHPNADRLSLTKVDVGADEILQIVCGAPNVAAGQKVLVATIGTTLYDAEGESWKIKKGKIRGEVSQGMICAEDELQLGTSHDGIMVLPADTPVGMLASDYFNLESDIVYDIGLTPNRSDATSHFGVARDLAAALKINSDHSGEIHLSENTSIESQGGNNPISVQVEDQAGCPRYSGVYIAAVESKASPDWLQNKLKALGIKPKNNLVDITNYILHDLGQPLHAFDASKIGDGGIVVKTLAEGTSFVDLFGKEHKLLADDLMICDKQGKGLCIAGVVGDLDSGVTASTTDIFLEAAHFNADRLRTTSRKHIRTDASRVFEKGSDPNKTMMALKKAAALFVELGGGQIKGDWIDVYPNKIEARKILVRYHKVDQLIGLHLPKEKVHEILTAMHIAIEPIDDQSFYAAIPTDKADVLREVDVIEEILRIYGFNKVPLPEQLKTNTVSSAYPDSHFLKNKIGAALTSRGFAEVMGLSLEESKTYEAILPSMRSELVEVNNTSVPSMDVMRGSMMMSALEIIQRNQNRQQLNCKIFEFGRTYKKKGEDFEETEQLTLAMTGARNPETWTSMNGEDTSFHSIKGQVIAIMQLLGIRKYQVKATEDENYSLGLEYAVKDKLLARFGILNESLTTHFDLRSDVHYASLQWQNILNVLDPNNVRFKPLNRFPSMRRDLALVVDNSIKFEDIAYIARSIDKKWLKEVNLFDVYRNKSQLGENKKSYGVSFVFEDHQKTLKDKEVDKVMQSLINAFREKLAAEIRA